MYIWGIRSGIKVTPHSAAETLQIQHHRWVLWAAQAGCDSRGAGLGQVAIKTPSATVIAPGCAGSWLGFLALPRQVTPGTLPQLLLVP